MRKYNKMIRIDDELKHILKKKKKTSGFNMDEFFEMLKKNDEKKRKEAFGNRYESFQCKKCGMHNIARFLKKCSYCGTKVSVNYGKY